MSTQSATDFEWSVKLIGDGFFNVGIASQLKPESKNVTDYDKNAILYSSEGGIKIGSKTIHLDRIGQKTGDVIRFRFQTQRKKLLIDLVRFRNRMSL